MLPELLELLLDGGNSPTRTPITEVLIVDLVYYGCRCNIGFRFGCIDGLQWYLDDVLVNLNITNPIVFEYESQSDQPVEDQQSSHITDFVRTDGTITDWMGWQGMIFREHIDPVDTLLEPTDLEDGLSLSYAETWDMEISDPTFAQFQLILPADLHSRTAEVRFEYSTDMGRRWNLVEQECYRVHQLSQQCEYLHPPSRYLINTDNNATRITVHLPRRSL